MASVTPLGTAQAGNGTSSISLVTSAEAPVGSRIFIATTHFGNYNLVDASAAGGSLTWAKAFNLNDFYPGFVTGAGFTAPAAGGLASGSTLTVSVTGGNLDENAHIQAFAIEGVALEDGIRDVEPAAVDQNPGHWNEDVDEYDIPALTVEVGDVVVVAAFVDGGAVLTPDVGTVIYSTNANGKRLVTIWHEITSGSTFAPSGTLASNSYWAAGAVVFKAPPPALPELEGVAQVDEELTVDDGIRSFSAYWWERADDDTGANLELIAGATSAAYTPTETDEGKVLRRGGLPSPVEIAYKLTSASATGRAGNGTISPPFPSGWAPGQLAVLPAYGDSGSLSITTGWTPITGSPWGSSTPKLYGWWRILQAGDSAPTITAASAGGGTHSYIGAMVIYGGAYSNAGPDPIRPIDSVGSGNQGTGTPATNGGTTTQRPGALALGIAGRGDDEAFSGQSFGGSTSGVSERLDLGTTQGDDSQLTVYEKTIASPGATGTGSATTSATDPFATVAISLNPGIYTLWSDPVAPAEDEETPVEQTVSAVYEALAPAGATGAAVYEALVSGAHTAPAPLEALAAVELELGAVWEALAGPAATAGAPWEARGRAAASAAAPWEGLVRVAVDVGAPVDAPLGVAAATAAAWEALAAVAAASAAPYEAGGRASASGALPYETIVRAGAIAAPNWESLAAAAATRDAPWEALVAAAAAAEAPWEARGQATGTAVIPWESLIRASAAAAAAVWESQTPAPAAAAAVLEALAATAAAVEAPWEAAAPAGVVAATVVLTYEALAAPRATAALPYETIVQLAQTVGAPVETLAAAAAAGAAVLEALAGVARAAAAPWEARGRVEVTAGAPWEALVRARAIAAAPYEAGAGASAAIAAPLEALAAAAALGVLPWEALGIEGVRGRVIVEALALASVRISAERIARALLEAGELGAVTIEVAD